MRTNESIRIERVVAQVSSKRLSGYNVHGFDCVARSESDADGLRSASRSVARLNLVLRRRMSDPSGVFEQTSQKTCHLLTSADILDGRNGRNRVANPVEIIRYDAT
jgi:hypothetical protein